MFEREMMISGLRKQRQSLSELIEQIEKGPDETDIDQLFCENQTRRISDNLRKLRRIKKSYFDFYGSSQIQKR